MIKPLTIFFVTLVFSQLCFAVNYEIDDIDFEFKDSESFDKTSLLDIMSLPKLNFFSSGNLGEDKERIKKFYFDNGFFDALIDTATQYDTEDKTVNVTIIIYEKQRYTLSKINIKGLSNINPSLIDEINSNPAIREGDNYTKTNVNNEVIRILDILQTNGYFKAKLDSTIIAKYSEDIVKNPQYKYKVVVSLVFAGIESVYYFGETKINFIGRKYQIEDNIIRRELTYSAGEIFDKDKLIKSEKNLTKLSILQSARIQIDTVIEKDKKINFVVNINFGNKYDVTPSIQAKDIDTKFFIGGGVEYVDKNFFGGGRVLTIKGEGLINSKDVNRISAEVILFQPYFIKSSITATFSSKIELFNISEFEQIIALKNLFRFTYDIASYTFYQVAYADLTIDINSKRVKRDYTNEEGLFIPKSTKNFLNSTLGITLIHNSTNNLFSPYKGLYHSITLEGAGLLPKLYSYISPSTYYSQYLKFYIPNKVFTNIWGTPNTVLALNFEAGDIIDFPSGEFILPVDKTYKFFSGGGTSVRGWSAQKNGILKDKAEGGKFLLEGNIEYRWNTFAGYRNFLKDVGTVYFFDYGNVWESDKKFKLSQLALAVGFGFRYFTFIGPVRIDFGFKLFDPEAADGDKWLFQKPSNIFKNKYAIQFGLGQAF